MANIITPRFEPIMSQQVGQDAVREWPSASCQREEEELGVFSADFLEMSDL